MKYWAPRLQSSVLQQAASGPAFQALEDICRRYAGYTRGFIFKNFWEVARADPKVMAAARTEKFTEEADAFVATQMKQSPPPGNKVRWDPKLAMSSRVTKPSMM
jgi:hypothetical protein